MIQSYKSQTVQNSCAVTIKERVVKIGLVLAFLFFVPLSLSGQNDCFKIGTNGETLRSCMEKTKNKIEETLKKMSSQVVFSKISNPQSEYQKNSLSDIIISIVDEQFEKQKRFKNKIKKPLELLLNNIIEGVPQINTIMTLFVSIFYSEKAITQEKIKMLKSKINNELEKYNQLAKYITTYNSHILNAKNNLDNINYDNTNSSSFFK